MGTDDGLVWRTEDGGGHWIQVTPAALTPWSKVGGIDLSHFQQGVAYIAIDRHRLNDETPYIYRTNDDGKSWTRIDSGIPRGSFVNVVREDPVRPGLLYAGTEFGIYVSFDDGAHWQSLQQSLPITSVRDIDVHGDDLVIATHGRGFWIMDDVSALRQMGDVHSGAVTLFNPRMRFACGARPSREHRCRRTSRWPPTLQTARSSISVACRGTGPCRGDDSRRKQSSSALVQQRGSRAGARCSDAGVRSGVGASDARSIGRAGMQRFLWDLRYATPAAPGSRHPRGTPGVGASGPVHRRADSGGTRLSPASRGETRSAGEPAASRIRA